MNRPQITASLSDLVRKRLSNQNDLWAEEVRLDNGEKRVDFVGFSKARDELNIGIYNSLERGIFSFYEVKSSLEDYNSGHGKNWEGDVNYLVCEQELADHLYQNMILPEGIIVLCPNSKRDKLVKKFDLTGNHVLGRKRPTVELLWDMIMKSDKNSKGVE